MYSVGSKGLIPEYVNRVLEISGDDVFTIETSEALKQFQTSYYNSYPEEDASNEFVEEKYVVSNGLVDIYSLPILCEIQLDPDNAYTIATAQFAMNVLDNIGNLNVTGYYDNFQVTIPESTSDTSYIINNDTLYELEGTSGSVTGIKSFCPGGSHTKNAIWNFQVKHNIGTSGNLFDVSGNFQSLEELNSTNQQWESSWTVDSNGNPIVTSGTINGVLMTPNGYYGVGEDFYCLLQLSNNSPSFTPIKVLFRRDSSNIPTGYIDIPTWNKMRTVYGAGGI